VFVWLDPGCDDCLCNAPARISPLPNIAPLAMSEARDTKMIVIPTDGTRFILIPPFQPNLALMPKVGICNARAIEGGVTGGCGMRRESVRWHCDLNARLQHACKIYDPTYLIL
jgi:hypothetical protein